MKTAFQLLLLLIWPVAIAAGDDPAASSALPELFDPARHLRVDEVREGMKGYGLTVFKGTTIERFDVEVVSVLKNFNPKRDVVLIRALGPHLEHTGAIAGMSGSPIFLFDEHGRPRLLGAFAYGWRFAKDPIAGVQPIQYMLEMNSPSSEAHQPDAPPAGARQSWDVLRGVAAAVDRFRPGNAGSGRPQASGSLRPLATPVTTSGAPAEVLRAYRHVFEAHNLLLAGAGGRGRQADARIEPGSVVVAPLLTGDVEFHANGTCTEVIGEHVFAFGHPFLNEGEAALPLAAGEVNAVVASMESSFKIAAVGPVLGTMHTDQTAGVAAKLGPHPEMLPIDVTIVRSGRESPFRFQAVRHPRLLPAIVAAAVDSALIGDNMLPQYNTVSYDLTMEFDNGRILRIGNVDTNVVPGGLLSQLVAPIAAAVENPFQRVLPRRITGRLQVDPEPRDSLILSVQIPKTRYRPGETISGFITHRPFRGEESDLPFSMQLPRDLPDGSYQLIVGDWTRF
ncbi:MAG: hypothetical protein NZ561_03580, partial [Phycisphaerae bacterium]|nr:hypothetical protein [Phycisphaerae bacterium]